MNTILDLRLNEMASGVRSPKEGHRIMAEELKAAVADAGLAS